MSRSNDNLKFTGLAVAVVAAAFGVGYYALGGQRPAPAPTEQTIIPSSTAPVQPVPVIQKPPANVTPRLHNSDYTAPGAPSIRIVEARTPSLTLMHRVPNPATDPAVSRPPIDTEASQETGSLLSHTGRQTHSPDTSTAPSGTDSGTSTPAPLIPPPPAQTAPPPPAETDFEQIGGHSASSGTDSNSGGKAQYRVQTGSFATQESARALADALHNRGYSTTTRTDQDNGKTVYKVQVGAYRSKSAADKAASDLQKNGYPAYTSPTGP